MIKRIMLLGAALGLQACGEETIEPYRVDSFAEREFPAAQKNASKALSISNASALEAADSPYAQALLCAIATEEVLGPFRQSAQLEEAQQVAVGQLLKMFAKQERAAALAAAKTPEELAEDRETFAAKFIPERQAKAKVALACIRELEENAG